ncbi:acidic mammalian chitinase-like [Phymastichus coffea]|uniref:acidic mammalian chitinase-like n=1 Tax=Phymastichus coffea TaxID=108790 RepID=UPI00273C89CF|nr:acidic mammalian chitinase-like [Phymastichus coffea]
MVPTSFWIVSVALSVVTAYNDKNIVKFKLRKLCNNEKLILSAVVIAFENLAEQSYIIPEIVEYLDLINLITWDLHRPWDKKTGINSPIYVGSWENGWERLLNVCAIGYRKVPQQKNSILPLHSRPYTADEGSLGYNEICEVQLAGGWSLNFQEEQRVPYAFEDQWIGYDNPKSVQEKAELINALGLGGAMLWTIERDDFRGICRDKFPLLMALNRVLRDGSQTATTVIW